MTWQPIETAPKDNKRLLYLANLGSDGKITQLDFDGAWCSESESWEMPEVYYFWGSANGIEEPTHWAYQDEPLPASHGANLYLERLLDAAAKENDLVRKYIREGGSLADLYAASAALRAILIEHLNAPSGASMNNEQQRAALLAYLKDCDRRAIVPDTAGAFNYAWQAAIALDRQQRGEPASILTAADVERQYENGIHVGSGLPREACPCGFCCAHRYGFNKGAVQPAESAEPVYQVRDRKGAGAWTDVSKEHYDHRGNYPEIMERRIVYNAPVDAQPSVPEIMHSDSNRVPAMFNDSVEATVGFVDGWNACRSDKENKNG